MRKSGVDLVYGGAITTKELPIRGRIQRRFWDLFAPQAIPAAEPGPFHGKRDGESRSALPSIILPSTLGVMTQLWVRIITAQDQVEFAAITEPTLKSGLLQPTPRIAAQIPVASATGLSSDLRQVRPRCNCNAVKPRRTWLQAAP